MTVVLAGIGADGINTNPMPPILEDDRFEYIPIPETETGTIETRTYGSERLRYHDMTMADYVDWIKPGGNDENRIDVHSEIEHHPFHYDPDFEHLTYGESEARSEYVRKLKKLDDGDVIAFYAGLDDGSRKNRYVIGYFKVEEVVSTAGLSGDRLQGLLEKHSHNAHAKRFLGAGKSKHEEVVIVDGREPGGLLDRASMQMSNFTAYDGNKTAQYYLADDFVRRFPLEDDNLQHDPDSSHKADKIYLGVKPAIELDMTGSEFSKALGDHSLTA
jgi:hypothetical protein